MTLYEITQDGFQQLQEGLKMAKEGAELSHFFNQRKETFLDENGILHVHISGALGNNLAPIYKELGSTDYKDISEDLRNSAKGVLLISGSPGGAVSGNIEVAKQISEMGIPVVSYVEGLACSAAYKLIAGTDYIVSSPSSTVGNIGTITTITDTSKIYEAGGITFLSITNEGADLKSTGHLPSLTDTQLEFLQETINSHGQAFKNHVLENRPGIDPEVFRAGWYSGQKAVELGLVDAIGTKQDALAALQELIALTAEI